MGSEAICKCMTTLLGKASAKDVVGERGARSKARGQGLTFFKERKGKLSEIEREIDSRNYKWDGL